MHPHARTPPLPPGVALDVLHAAHSSTRQVDPHAYYGSFPVPVVGHPPMRRPSLDARQPTRPSPPRLDAPEATPEGCRQWVSVWAFARLIAYNLGNTVLGLGGALGVAVGLALAVLSLPFSFCSSGLVVPRAILRMVYTICWIDVGLHNLLIQDEDLKIYLPPTGLDPLSSQSPGSSLLPLILPSPHRHHRNHTTTTTAISHLQLEPTLAECSPRAVLAGVYVGSVKLLLGLASALGLALLQGCLLLFLSDQDELPLITIASGSTEVHWAPFPTLPTVLLVLAVLVLAMGLLHITARVAQAATRFFCCRAR